MPTHARVTLYRTHVNLYRKTSGFSFVELMISMAIFSIILLAAFEVIISQKKTLSEDNKLLEASQNVRASQDILLRELRMSGYKVLEADFLNYLSSWISSEYLPTYPKPVNLSGNTCPIITEGDGTDPDIITLFMADIKENALLSNVNANSTTLLLDANSPGFTNISKFRTNDVIRIGDHSEFAKVVAVGTNNTLTIDTNPITPGNQGVANSYPVGTPVREINIITYTVFNDDNDPSYQYHQAEHPVLMRQHNENNYTEIAGDVEDLQITPTTFPNYRLRLVSRTSTPGDYAEGSPDGYKRTDLVADFRLRNFIETSCLAPKAPVINSLSGLDYISPCHITVSWNAVTQDLDNSTLPSECAVSSYIVTYATTPQARTYTIYPDSGTSCDIDISAIQDPNQQNYYISVAAVNPGGVSAYSVENSISDSSPPSAVSDPNATSSGHQIAITWSDDPECDVSQYRIYRSLSPSGPFSLIATETNIVHGDSATYSFEDINLACDTYYYTIKAFDNKYESANSTIVYATITDNDSPSDPTNFSFSIVGDTVNLNWTLSIDDPNIGLGDNDVVEYSFFALVGESEILLDDPALAGQNSQSRSTEGYSNFGIKAVDICGNVSNLVTQSESCQSAPTIAINNPSPAPEATFEGNVTVSGTVTSSNSILWVKLKIDSGDWTILEGTSNWSYLWDTSSFGNGPHTITLQAMDDEGCHGTTSLTLTVQNEGQGADNDPPSFGNINQSLNEDQSMRVCVLITDPSGILSAVLSTNFDGDIPMSDPEPDGTYCATIPSHHCSEVTYSITAKDNSPNQNESPPISSSYRHPEDCDPPVISNVILTSLGISGSQKTIQITATITDASGIASATFSFSGSGGSGSGILSPTGGNNYQATYNRHKNFSCTVTISVTDTATPSNTATYSISDEGV